MLQNRPTLGSGFYTPPEISLILKIPPYNIRWYIDEVWDNRFGIKQFNERYSWDIRNQKAVNFLVLIEFKMVLSLKKIGLSTQKILKARNTIAEEEKLPYPFASSRLLANSEKIWYEINDVIIDADGSRQMNFSDCVRKFTDCLDFKNEVASRFWPDTKKSSVVIDPHHQFGQPIIFGTNITTETIFNMHESGESISVISRLYNISEKNIKDALSFSKRKAA